MNMTCETLGDALLIALEGKLNSVNAPQTEADMLAQITRGAHQVLLDLTALDYISSAGLRVLLIVAKRLKQCGGLLVLCGLQSQIREVLDISGFLAILTVADTREQGLRHFS
ncbi:STAS domain-containing protein [Janthinobacterium sp. PC23-8]|uniref:STAS domain-containing protein n=1 Tax=Janthinobacterium sp. PC23-8 TaxID=2012679 RepID=UPI000B967558|nr:STAS domain-containing protein [Janthinobacterium sp. PC23-8]OYO27923.1 anti-anti-sigma factor [Janthinobacterium sp. PC23-8]